MESSLTVMQLTQYWQHISLANVRLDYIFTLPSTLTHIVVYNKWLILNSIHLVTW